MCDLRVQSNPGVRVQYARTILMTKFASCTLYAVPRVCVQSEVYFGLKSYLSVHMKKKLKIQIYMNFQFIACGVNIG